MVFVSIVASIVTSLACDRYDMRWIIGVSIISQIVGYACLPYFHVPWGYWFSVIGLGISQGCFGPLLNAGLPFYVGRKHLGAIGGAQLQIVFWSSAGGPLLISIGAQITNSLASMVSIGAWLPLLVVPLLFLITKDQHHVEE